MAQKSKDGGRLPIPQLSKFDAPEDRVGLRRKGNVNMAVAEVIGSRIVRGKYLPGTVLPHEAAWAQAFGVSRSVVREAIKMLSAKSLLTSRPRVGSRVEPRENWNLLDHEVLNWYTTGPERSAILRSLQQFRHIFEPEAAALAAKYRTAEQMQVISDACEQMATTPSLQERTAADVKFHLSILKASNNELLVPLGVLIDSALKNLFVLITVEAGDVHYAQDLHNNIEKAIRQQKPETARKAVRKLLENSDNMIAKWTKQHQNL